MIESNIVIVTVTNSIRKLKRYGLRATMSLLILYS